MRSIWNSTDQSSATQRAFLGVTTERCETFLTFAKRTEHELPPCSGASSKTFMAQCDEAAKWPVSSVSSCHEKPNCRLCKTKPMLGISKANTFNATLIGLTKNAKNAAGLCPPHKNPITPMVLGRQSRSNHVPITCWAGKQNQ